MTMLLDSVFPVLMIIGFFWLISKIFDTSSLPPTKKEVDDFIKLLNEVEEESRKRDQEYLRKIGKL